MRLVFAKEDPLPAASCAVSPIGHISFLKETGLEVPVTGLRTSNGWAVATSATEATRRAYLEAYERHTLQLGFWRTGGAFLTKIEEKKFEDSTVHLFQVPHTPAPVCVIVAASQSPYFPGLAFGHQASFGEPDYDHVLIESVQNAEAYRFSKDQDSDSAIDQAQRIFLEKGDFHPGLLEGKSKFLPGWPEKVDVLTVDLATVLGLSYPLKCCWVSSPELLPLYVITRMNPSERENMAATCARFGLSHPLEQTPFV